MVGRVGGEASRPVGGGRGVGGAKVHLPEGGAIRAKRMAGATVVAGKGRAVEGAGKVGAEREELQHPGRLVYGD